MSKATDRAKKLLEGVEGSFPVRLNEMTVPSDTEVIGTLRKPDGYPVLSPHPESMSMLVGPRPVFDYLTQSYGVIESLIAEIEAVEAGSGAKKQNSPESAPNSA